MDEKRFFMVCCNTRGSRVLMMFENRSMCGRGGNFSFWREGDCGVVCDLNKW